METTRRTFLLSASALSVGGLLSACRATDEGTSGPSSQAAATATEAKAFPVTIKHKFGSTTLTKAPTRVVCVGLVEQDMLLALGIVPVAVTEWLKAAPHEIYPWVQSKLGSATPPVVLPSADGIAVEKIAALKPDLIIGQYAGVTAAEYDKLSKIAPTVAQPKEYVDYGVPWDVNARNVGLAVGQPARAEQLIRAVRTRFASERASHPQFAGKSAAVVTAYDGIYIYGPQDPRSQVLKELGFSFPEKFKTIGGSKEFGGTISTERTRELELDAIVWLDDAAKVDKTTGGLWKQTRTQREGRAIYVPYEEKQGTPAATYASALTIVTPLSLPYLLDTYVPQLAAAVDGKTSTPVPAPRG
ncbi:iron-siderophore ABC transporter substrate-binding protein [Luteipulveratus mongoliensis]|uniref:Fe/B12 periplasmic-binding domain-containing protein n=1 Tax=Luteipulveratus mongoliensis TaxID=571913 RepID=A0A0K1JP35_9MICO|nr:iron-siderophore ABC transporter substrate-binding protein [Luteipulveratus mongoliensis]AKU18348.1 hypothetical protein VV02_25040 [Luteipulveratus mongoliensis]